MGHPYQSIPIQDSANWGRKAERLEELDDRKKNCEMLSPGYVVPDTHMKSQDVAVYIGTAQASQTFSMGRKGFLRPHF